MYPLFIIAKREFLQRVRQKSFWIMLLLGPFFMIVVMTVPIGLAIKKEQNAEILYLDESRLLDNYLYTDKAIKLVKASGGLKETFQKAKKASYAGVLTISKDTNHWQCRFYPSTLMAQSSEVIRLIIKDRIVEYELGDKQNVIIPKVYFREASMAEIEKGEADSTAGFVAGLFTAVLVLIFINQYAHMVLRGIVEEKQNRISELILTSIKPMSFITGKIIGIASVAFLQMIVWLALTGSLTALVYNGFRLERFSNENLASTLENTRDLQQAMEVNTMLNAITSLDGAGLAAGFLFYFIFGYLLFSALFAMVGIAVGSDTDAQQLAIPFTLPLALPIIFLQYIMDNQESTFTHILSIFPLTSPTTMLLRLPMGVPLWEIAVSAGVLIGSFILSAFIASKVYRIGVLMYGKKFTISEIVKLAGNN